MQEGGFCDVPKIRQIHRRSLWQAAPKERIIAPHTALSWTSSPFLLPCLIHGFASGCQAEVAWQTCFIFDLCWQILQQWVGWSWLYKYTRNCAKPYNIYDGVQEVFVSSQIACFFLWRETQIFQINKFILKSHKDNLSNTKGSKSSNKLSFVVVVAMSLSLYCGVIRAILFDVSPQPLKYDFDYTTSEG